MPAGIWALEWQNSNSQRSYPLAENGDGVDQSGTFTIPDEFMLELDLPVHAGLNIDPGHFFILTLTAYATGFSIIIGYQPAIGSPISVATALIARSSHAPGNVYAVGGIGDFSDTVGKIVIGRLDDIDLQPVGSFNFDYANTLIDPDCIRPIIRGVSSIRVSAGAQISQPLYGDIVLVADQNVQLTTVVQVGQDPQILISAIQGEGLVEACVCVGNQNGDPILTINGIGPDPGGNFSVISGNECVEIDGIQNGITIGDSCSQPCCGCAELEQITNDLEMFGSEYSTLSNFVNNLQSQVINMDQVVLGSKLNDTGCVVCS